MPEHEFEIYLSVLSRLVKLTPAQKASIADELRDHLEERFVELVRAGQERDVAIRQALDEFGDASGLAVDLTAVSKKRIPRWVVGSTAVTVAVAMLTLAWVFLFAPPETIPNSPNTVSAQDARKATPQATPQATTKVAATVPVKLILDEGPDDLAAEFLTRPYVLELTDTPLRDVVQLIAKQTGVPVLIDKSALNDSGITLDERITFSIGTTPPTKPDEIKRNENGELQLPKGVRARPLCDVLSIMLDSYHLGWYVEEGILHITTVEALDSIQLSRSYDVRSLLDRGIEAVSLTSAIQEMTNVPWEESDGSGGVLSLVENVLTVRHSYPAQREVRALIEGIANPREQRFTQRNEDIIEAQQRLDRVVDAHFVDVPLAEAVKKLSVDAETPLRLDVWNLEEAGISPDEPIHLQLKGRRLETVLKAMLNSPGLTVTIRYGELLVTTEDALEDMLTTAIYDLRDLNQPRSRLIKLVEAIPEMTSGYWADVDGSGGSIMCLEDGTLCIEQTERVHRQLARYIRLHRRSFAKRVQAPERPDEMITKFYRMPIETAEDLFDALPDTVQPESWRSESSPNGGTLQVISLGRKTSAAPRTPKTDGNKKPATQNTSFLQTEPSVLRSSLAVADRTVSNVLTQFGGGNMSGVVPFAGNGMGGVVQFQEYAEEAVLVIRQTRGVHLKIDQFLLSLGLKTVGPENSRQGLRVGVGSSQL